MIIHTNSYLSREETKKILTPFAFEIDKSLFGLPLAVPRKRAIALLVDFIFIAILAEMPGELFALAVAFTFYQLGSCKKQTSHGKPRWSIGKGLLRVVAVIILFITLLSFFSPYVEQWSSDDTPQKETHIANNNMAIVNTVAMTIDLATQISNSQCSSQACFYKLITPLLDKYIDMNIPVTKMQSTLTEVISETELSDEEKASLIASLMDEYSHLGGQPIKTEEKGEQPDKEETVSSDTSKTKKIAEKSIGNKGFDWIKSKIEGLGLSFGWAALYFSVLTSVWNGQTFGKKLMKIRVIQLDGTRLSVWDSFGRYGGYGAGLATGLMGFLQIYWDPNRQCIHDKISSTVVIDLKKLKQH
ncbi:RDD family protein [Thalassotalea piscium]